MSIKEQYWKYSLIVIILFMGVIIFRQITPFLGGLLGALTMYILVRTHMNYLTEKRKMKRSISVKMILLSLKSPDKSSRRFCRVAVSEKSFFSGFGR